MIFTSQNMKWKAVISSFFSLAIVLLSQICYFLEFSHPGSTTVGIQHHFVSWSESLMFDMVLNQSVQTSWWLKRSQKHYNIAVYKPIEK